VWQPLQWRPAADGSGTAADGETAAAAAAVGGWGI
jgi:hypothetical protein